MRRNQKNLDIACLVSARYLGSKNFGSYHAEKQSQPEMK